MSGSHLKLEGVVWVKLGSISLCFINVCKSWFHSLYTRLTQPRLVVYLQNLRPCLIAELLLNERPDDHVDLTVLKNNTCKTLKSESRLGNKSEKRPINHVRESGMLEGVIHARYLYWPLLATPSLDDTWFEALNANYGRFSKWPPNILQMYIRWDLVYVLETWSWCLNICFWCQGIHWAYLFEDIIDQKFNKAHMMQKYCKFIPCIHCSVGLYLASFPVCTSP